MKIFFAPATGHLEPFIPGERGQYKIRKFNDGELLLKLEDQVEQQPVTVITATQPPAKHFVELFLLLDTLKQQNARVHVIFTYFGYERQDHPKPNVARGAQVVANCLKQFELDRVTIIHPHSPIIKQLFPAQYIVPYDLYAPLVKQLEIDTIVAPDDGAMHVCQDLAHMTGCALGVIEKERISGTQVKPISVQLPENTKRALIFDDIISTGATLVQAAQLLQNNGVNEIYALATHCFINELGLQKLFQSPIKHMWISNTIPIHFSCPQMSVINIAPAITKIIAE